MLGTPKTVALSTKARKERYHRFVPDRPYLSSMDDCRGLPPKQEGGRKRSGTVLGRLVGRGQNPKDKIFPVFPKPGLEATTTHRIIGSAQWARKDKEG